MSATSSDIYGFTVHHVAYCEHDIVYHGFMYTICHINMWHIVNIMLCIMYTICHIKMWHIVNIMLCIMYTICHIKVWHIVNMILCIMLLIFQ